MCAEFYKTRLLYPRCYGKFGWRKKARQYNPLVAQVHLSVNKSLLSYCGLVLVAVRLWAASEMLRSRRF
ncbi:hypothetical protein IV02_02535 [Pseudomonas syringae]|uniref:Uncharacterized protein n=1 Tax=Pseudomonas syringae TaxID=317 RepID=A0A085VJM1_PSESX|nr:hypothetical protein IV02_02535 [Pseudomonas syringae]